MKAVVIEKFGPALKTARVSNIEAPRQPGPGEALLDILAAPINPSDFLVFEGRFGAVPPALPMIAGGEAVAQVAPDATGPATQAAAVEFILEGLHLNKRLNKDAVSGQARYRG